MTVGKANDDLYDVMLQYVIDNTDTLTLCSAVITAYADIATYKLAANAAMDSGEFTGPENGPTDGRDIEVAAQSSLSVTATGTPVICVLSDSVGEDWFVYAPTSTAQELTSGNTVNTTAWKFILRDVA